MPRPNHHPLLSLLCLPLALIILAPAAAQNGGDGEREKRENGQQQQSQTEEEKGEGKRSQEQEEELEGLREKRAQTIKYGIDSQILGLVEQLKEEKNDRHNEALVEVFQRTSNPKLQSAIASFFKSRESEALKEPALELLSDYEDQRTELVTSLITYLQDYQDEKITELFAEMSEEPRDQVASKAVIALGESGKSEYTEKLIGLYEQSASDSMKSTILKALGKLGSSGSIDLLTEVVKDDDNSKSLRWNACQALGYIGDPKVLDTIEYLFGEDDPYLRMHAVQALSNFSAEDVKPMLMEALRDDFWRVRTSAAESLGTLGVKDAVSILIFKAKHDPERNNVAPAAVKALGKIGGKESYDFLREVYRNDDYSFSMRMTALRSLIEGDLRNSLAVIREVIEEEWEEEKTPKILEYTCKELSTTENRILQPLYQKMLGHHRRFHIPIYGLRGIRLNGLRALESDVEKLTGEEYNRHVRELAKSVLDEL